MTKTEACKMLRVSPSASLAKKEQAYRQIQKSLQLRLIPGNSLTERQKAREQLGKIATAYQILQKSPAYKRPAYKTATTRPTATRPETLGDAWGLLVERIPLPEPVIAILLVVVIVLVVIGLFGLFS